MVRTRIVTVWTSTDKQQNKLTCVLFIQVDIFAMRNCNLFQLE